MSENIVYKEKRASIGITIIVGVVTLAMTGFLIAQLIYGPLGSKPAPTWILAALAGFFLLTTLNFMFVTITLTDTMVKVNYGIFGVKRYWKDLAVCELDEMQHFYGWGIRFGRYKKQWVWVYNVIGGPRVVFLTKNKKPKGLIVSTCNPDEIVALAGKYI